MVTVPGAESGTRFNEGTRTTTMMKSTSTQRLALGLALTAALASSLAGGSAHADPKQYDQQIIGVGSDTTENVMNAMTGYENGTWYTPVHGTSNNRTIVSWDATVGGLQNTCITTKTGGPSFNRPFGSGAGRAALQTTLNGGAVSVTNCGTGTTSASGNLSFARSSSLSGTAAVTGSPANLAYVPFALDALSYGAYRQTGTPVTDLSTTELTAIFTTAGGVDIVRGAVTTHVYGCGINPSSGTGTTWLTKIGVTTANTSFCDGLINPATTTAFGPQEENNGQNLVDRGIAADLATPGSQVIVGFSAGNYIGKANLAAAGGMPATVIIGSISNIAGGAAPVLGTAPNMTPNPAYFVTTNTFARLLYNVFPDSVINSANPNLFPDLKQIFKGNSTTGNSNPASICAQTATITKFGFLTIGALCGDTTTIRGA
jgi:hypothetical protein